MVYKVGTKVNKKEKYSNWYQESVSENLLVIDGTGKTLFYVLPVYTTRRMNRVSTAIA